MTVADESIRAAEAEVAVHRQRVAASVRDLKNKVNPKRIAKQAVADATVAGESAAIAGADTIRRYPGTLAGVVAAAGLFLARHRIAYLIRRALGDETETGARR